MVMYEKPGNLTGKKLCLH